MKKKWLLIIGGLVLVIIGLFIRTQSKNNIRDSFNFTEDMVMSVEKGELKKTVSGIGYLEPWQTKTLSFPFSGQVEKVIIEEGTVVSEGQELIALDQSQQELNYIREKNKYETIKINGSQSQIREQELILKIAQQDLKRTVIKAPFSGLILDVLVEENDYVTGGQKLVKLIDNQKYLIEVNIDESDIEKIAIGQKAIISFDALEGREFRAKVNRIAPYSQNINGLVTVAVSVLLTETDPLLKVGFSAELDIVIASTKEEIIVPVTATFTEDEQDYVVMVKEGELLPTPVITGISDGVYLEITEGLELGDQILINTFHYANINGNSQIDIRMGPFGR